MTQDSILQHCRQIPTKALFELAHAILEGPIMDSLTAEEGAESGIYNAINGLEDLIDECA